MPNSCQLSNAAAAMDSYASVTAICTCRISCGSTTAFMRSTASSSAKALRWIDVISDAAFLIMDCEVRDRSDLAYAFLDRYLEQIR